MPDGPFRIRHTGLAMPEGTPRIAHIGLAMPERPCRKVHVGAFREFRNGTDSVGHSHKGEDLAGESHEAEDLTGETRDGVSQGAPQRRRDNPREHRNGEDHQLEFSWMMLWSCGKLRCNRASLVGYRWAVNSGPAFSERPESSLVGQCMMGLSILHCTMGL